MKLFLSAPYFNDVSLKVVQEFPGWAKEAGFEVCSPLDHPMDPDWPAKRFKDLKSCRAAFVWLDSLLPPGQFLYRLKNVARDQIAFPMPPPLLQLMAAGLQATGQAKMQPKKGILLPGESPMEMVNLPRELRIGSPGGVFAEVVGNGALNVPEPTTMFELGMAVAEMVPVIGLCMASPSVGPYKRILDFEIRELDHISRVLKELRPILEESQEALSPGEMVDIREKMAPLQKELDEMAEKRQAETRKRVLEAIAKKTGEPDEKGT